MVAPGVSDGERMEAAGTGRHRAGRACPRGRLHTSAVLFCPARSLTSSFTLTEVNVLKSAHTMVQCDLAITAANDKRAVRACCLPSHDWSEQHGLKQLPVWASSKAERSAHRSVESVSRSCEDEKGRSM